MIAVEISIFFLLFCIHLACCNTYSMCTLRFKTTHNRTAATKMATFMYTCESRTRLQICSSSVLNRGCIWFPVPALPRSLWGKGRQPPFLLSIFQASFSPDGGNTHLTLWQRNVQLNGQQWEISLGLQLWCNFDDVLGYNRESSLFQAVIYIYFTLLMFLLTSVLSLVKYNLWYTELCRCIVKPQNL